MGYQCNQKNMLLNYCIKFPIHIDKHNFTSKITIERRVKQIILCKNVIECNFLHFNFFKLCISYNKGAGSNKEF